MKYLELRCEDAAVPADAFDLFPGSDEAVEAGCICPTEQPEWPLVRVGTECPVHEIESAPPRVN